ncbi:hypothetical protein BC940DRAFT_328385 [Gongronella butleri]|nr:hypothetical protein BC940DRAFT_328385 [Gongronella butleri]
MHAQQHEPAARSASSSWERTLDRCIKSIVSIKATRVKCLDTEIPGAFSATGFVVDAERGLILSNRHVVSVSPIIAQAVLCNYEEIDLQPIYRDPIHDFGFLKYDPAQLRFLDVPAIPLYPQGARVGQEIRVVGNDAGEKLSILSGTLARLDRQAPEYGTGEYNDFNTFYYQAASGTSAGSSGSPVLDLAGRAIALNAGGATRSSSSYYLPLHRVQRALACLQQEIPIPRGTLQMEMVYRSFDELKQLGLASYMEQRLRQMLTDGIIASEGLLVVKSVLPEGPAADKCEPGDILLSGNGDIIASFIDFEALLDSHVDKPIQLVFSRAGHLIQVDLRVQDMHALVPHKYVEFGGGVVHDLSYQMAHSYGLSLRDPGVYVASSGYILGTAYCVRRSVIRAVNNQPVNHLADFIRIVQQLPHGARVPIRYYSLNRAKKEKIMLLHVDRRWHPFHLVTRQETGLWDYVTLPSPNGSTGTSAESASTDKCPNEDALTASVRQAGPMTAQEPMHQVAECLVSIDCYPPFIIDGLQTTHAFGAGLVVSLDPPMIVCDRDAVPVAVCDISVTFRNAVTVDAHVLFLHPFYNYAILAFDIAGVTRAGYRVQAATLSNKPLDKNDPVHYVGLGGDSMPVIKNTYVAGTRRIRTKECKVPRYRAVNVEVAKTGEPLNGQGGVLCNAKGAVQAFWMNFSIDDDDDEPRAVMGGLANALWVPMVEAFRTGNKDAQVVYGLEAECWSMQLAHARLMQLPDHWMDRFSSQASPHVLYILGFTNPSSACTRLLQVGDLVLEINGKLIASVNDLHQFDTLAEIDMVVFRDGQEQRLRVPLTPFDGQETTRVIGWQGMYIQDAYQAAREQVRERVPEGVYVSCCLFGSPAQLGVQVGVWITEIDQVRVPTLDAFLDVVTQLRDDDHVEDEDTSGELSHLTLEDNPLNDASRPDSVENSAKWLLARPTAALAAAATLPTKKTHVRVKYVTRSNVTHVSMLRLDWHYWPTWQINKDTTNLLGWTLKTFPGH